MCENYVFVCEIITIFFFDFHIKEVDFEDELKRLVNMGQGRTL